MHDRQCAPASCSRTETLFLRSRFRLVSSRSRLLISHRTRSSGRFVNIWLQLVSACSFVVMLWDTSDTVVLAPPFSFAFSSLVRLSTHSSLIRRFVHHHDSPMHPASLPLPPSLHLPGTYFNVVAFILLRLRSPSTHWPHTYMRQPGPSTYGPPSFLSSLTP